MNKTANFQLTQWEKTDRIMMEDFNRDNAAIDAALKGNAEAVAAETAAREAADTALGKKAGLQRLRQRGDQYRLVAVGGGLCGFSTGIQRFHEKLQSVFLAQ